MQQLLYISTAPNLPNSEIEQILDACKRNNKGRGVTGFLLYNGRNFFQLLEGDRSDISWIMGRINTDPRHSGVTIIEQIDADERACPEWSMRKIRLVDDVDNRRAALDAELPDALDSRIRRAALNFASLN